MCFFNSQNKRAFEIAKRYGRKSDIVEIAREILEEQEREAMAPEGGTIGTLGTMGTGVQKAFLNPDCLIVTRDEQLQMAKWGLIPFWVRDLEKVKSIRNMTANARCETVFTQPSFREAIRKRRCLVPSTSFYEYHHLSPGPSPKERGERKEAVPYRIFLRDMEVFSLAGMYEEWIHTETKETVRTFSVVTVPANELCAFIHNGGRNQGRMPAVLQVADEERWLRPGLSENDIRGLLVPYDTHLMDAGEMEKDYLRRA